MFFLRKNSKEEIAGSKVCVLKPLIEITNSAGQNTGVGRLSLLQGNLPNPGIKPRSPTLQEDSLPAEPPGKPSHNYKIP